MTPIHAILIVIIRLWAASAIITAITYFPATFLFQEAEAAPMQNITFQIYNFVNSTIWLASGVLAWVLAPRLSKMAYGNPNEKNVNVTIDANALVMTGGFLIGCFYLVQYAPSWLADIGAILVEYSRQDPNAPYELGKLKIHRFDAERIFKEGLIMLVAAWMAFRPAQLAAIFSHLRQAGLRQEKPED